MRKETIMKNSQDMESLMECDNRHIGYVSKFNPDKGFGFIKSKKDQQYYFVHISQVLGSDRLNVGDIVEFSIGFNQRANKEQAVDVLIMENR